MKFVIIALMLLAATFARHPINKEIVEEIKRSTTQWWPVEPEDNIFQFHNAEQITSMLGTKMDLERDIKVAEEMGIFDYNLESVEAVPAAFDSREEWADICPFDIKDQGQCGSCWAFSATAAFEARSELANKHVDTLYAEQELVDCDTQSEGCNGGFMDYAFEYLQSHGFCTESKYPYTARDGTCGFAKNGCSAGPEDKSIVDIPAGDEEALLAELMNGPVAVAVDANTWSFYSGGVLSSCGKDLDHGVTLVASNFEEGWVKIRNSWGNSWGESGYIRLKINEDMCGYADVASVPSF